MTTNAPGRENGHDSIDAIDVLEFSQKTGKRAVYEEFDLVPLGDGDVEVTNESHADGDAHTYTVHVVGGIPSDCTCPADECHDGACKHRVAVALAEPIMEVAEDGDEVALADGGQLVDADTDDEDGRPDDCDCGDLHGFIDLPCWPCYREGFDVPNPDEPGADE